MGFLGIYKAIYDYTPQGEGELTISEGDVLYVLEKSTEDDWWKAKRKATTEEDDEPVGLIPSNYIEEVKPTQQARALFDYTRQTDEELSFKEESHLQVFDTSDPDWILVGLDGDYGFAPSNYIEVEEEAPPTPVRPVPAQRQPSEESEDFNAPEPEAAATPASALAGVLQGRQQAAEPPRQLPPRPQLTPESSDGEDAPTPSLPARPQSQTIQSPRSPPPAGPIISPPHNRVSFATGDHPDNDNYAPRTSGGFHLYNINEMVSVMGKRKKMPTTLGINLATGIITIAPEKTRDGPQQEWTADKMTHYSIEGKHVFLELVKPSKSIDFHAGAKDTAQEIVFSLGEMSGAVRAEGLREVLSAATGQEKKKGQILYDFMAQGDDEVTVAVGDEVIILDDSKSDEWWQVRRLKNGKQGVVPSSYVEITGTMAVPDSHKGVNAGMSAVEQNRLEEQKLAKEALKAGRGDGDRAPEVGPGMILPPRGSSLHAPINNNRADEQRSRRESRQPESGSSRGPKAKPDPSKVRTWTDRSKSFSVEAQFLALKDGKINLHKMNGVKIAVPVSKMSIEDLEYVENMTGVSLDEDKPLSEYKKSKSRESKAGASIEKKPDHDWFNFFLSCDIGVGLCERYSQVFNRDNMDESVLPDVDATVLRNLGLREGDILKIMRHLDTKYNRKGKKGSDEAEGEGGLFSGAGGALRNNTRKGRPAPTTQTSDTVDPKAFSQQNSGEPQTKTLAESVPTPIASAPAPVSKSASGGFDDDAWDVKPAKQAQPQPQQADPAPVQPPPPTLTGSMQELSLLSQPLQPTKVEPVTPQPPQQQVQAQPQLPQPTGASPSFFTNLPQPGSAQQQQGFQPQQNIARQRPAAPQFSGGQGSLMPPPPARPLSAPQTAQQSAFGPPPPLQPQMTGIPNQPTGYQSIAPPGQSLAEMNQMRMLQQQQQLQQQYNQQQMPFQPQMTGFPNQQNMMMPQPTGFQPNQNFMQGQPSAGPFADPRGVQPFSPIQSQPTGFQSPFNPQQQYPQQTGVNNYLPPALQPQKTGPMFSQPTGMNNFGQGPVPPLPPMPQQAPAPLLPQKTGPPPPVRFGVKPDAKKLAPQPTGKRANLAAATPDNPFGF
ncbi:hypothetical protein VF21_06999 [Pseudogymnoascus sp. 05NY08]|nr:hypothetical protein VF21_06999 [Pseudogymnoascus sp. 05NY08]